MRTRLPPLLVVALVVGCSYTPTSRGVTNERVVAGIVSLRRDSTGAFALTTPATRARQGGLVDGTITQIGRSEERRVGKECTE